MADETEAQGADGETEDSKKKAFEKVHDEAHDLANHLIAAMQEWMASRPPQSVATGTVLLGTEMLPSIVRRVCRDAGMPKEVVKAAQKMASQCALGYYEASKKMQDMVSKAEADVRFVVPTDPDMMH